MLALEGLNVFKSNDHDRASICPTSQFGLSSEAFCELPAAAEARESGPARIQ